MAGVADQQAGTAISRHRRVAIMALPPRTPCPARMSSPAVTAVSWCSQAAIVAASSAPPHPGQVDLGVSGGQVPQRGAELAVAEDVLRPWCGAGAPVLGGHRLARGGHLQVRQDKGIGVDRLGARPFGERQGALVRVQGAAAPGPRVGGDLGRIQRHPADQQPGVCLPPVRAVLRRGDRAPSMSIASCQSSSAIPASSRRWRDPLGADREADVRVVAARASCPAK